MRIENKGGLARCVLAVSAAVLMSNAQATTPLPKQTTAGTSDRQTAAEALEAFLRCDASFFRFLASNPKVLGDGVEVRTNGQIASPRVDDFLKEDGQLQTFARPLEVEGLKLVAWRNEVGFIEHAGTFLYWGFDIAATPEKVAATVNGLLPADGQVSKEGRFGARVEHQNSGDDWDLWRKGGSPNGTITPKGVVERVLLVEPNDEQHDHAKLYCSLQGAVTNPLLRRARPDLPDTLNVESDVRK